MAEGKWINDLKEDTPIADAARRVLTVRLEVVRDSLRLAVRTPHEDIEYVHQLRVGTRRAGAAVDIFAGCLPDKIYRSARKKLKLIRRAAGAARDWDVVLEELRERGHHTTDVAGWDFLLGYALAQRTAAQAQLEAASPEEPAGLERFVAETVASIRLPREEGTPAVLQELARPMLIELVARLELAAAGDLTDYEHLHQVRIVGKRLRYAMEIFASCFPPKVRDQFYGAVVAMQEILGRANDSHVACQRLEVLRQDLQRYWPGEWRRLKPGIDSLLRFHQRRLPQERLRFEKWWSQHQQASEEANLLAMLKNAGLAVS